MEAFKESTAEIRTITNMADLMQATEADQHFTRVEFAILRRDDFETEKFVYIISGPERGALANHMTQFLNNFMKAVVDAVPANDPRVLAYDTDAG